MPPRTFEVGRLADSDVVDVDSVDSRRKAVGRDLQFGSIVAIAAAHFAHDLSRGVDQWHCGRRADRAATALVGACG
jgi:hypothetical protein